MSTKDDDDFDRPNDFGIPASVAEKWMKLKQAKEANLTKLKSPLLQPTTPNLAHSLSFHQSSNLKKCY